MKDFRLAKVCRRMKIPVGIFMIGQTICYELLFRYWIGEPLTAHWLVVPLCFAAFTGGVLGLLPECLPEKWARLAVGILSFLLASVYLTVFFLYDAYHMFMPPALIFRGAKGVTEDYGDIVRGLLLRDSWRIVLLLLPTAIFAGCVGIRERNRVGILRQLGAAVCALLLALGATAGIHGGLGILGRSYDYEGGIRSLGVPGALVQNLVTDVLPGEEIPLTLEVPEYVPPTTVPEERNTEETVPEETEPVVYEPNVLDVDFEALALKERGLAGIHNYIAAQEPTLKNEYTGLFAGKNLILITAEAFTKEVIDPLRTPTLYRMAKLGIEFTDFYQPAWGASTTSGEMSNLFGLVPDNTGGMGQMTAQRPFITMGYQLGKQGYWSACYHNNEGSFYDRNLTHPYLGYDKFISRDNGVVVGSAWPMSDLEMMESTVPTFIDEPKFNVYYITLSGHSVYDFSVNAMARKNWDVVKDLPYTDPVKCYLAGNQELEYAMEYLVNMLEEKGIADDTVIVISPDHYPYGLDASHTWGNYDNCVAELFGIDEADYNPITRDHSGLIIWSDCIEGMNLKIDTPTYSLDLLPTLCNLFGLEYDSRMFVGRDVFSQREPLVLWPNGSWLTTEGRFLKNTNTFTPNPGVEVEPEYVDYMSAVVLNKINYSYAVQRQMYLFRLDRTMKQLAEEQMPTEP